MNLLAFDLSGYKMGFAVGEVPPERVIHYAQIDTDKTYSHDDRAYYIQDMCLKLIRQYKPHYVVMEDCRGHYAGGKRLHEFYMHGNLMVVQRYCHKQGIQSRYITRKSMYKFHLGVGKGSAEKEELLQTLTVTYNTRFDNDDQSDAYGFCKQGMRLIKTKKW